MPTIVYLKLKQRCTFKLYYMLSLFMIATPSELLNLSVTHITYESCELEWTPPSDNGGGGKVISHYSVAGTPDDISIITGNTMYTRQDLTPNTIYTFNVSATNSLGFGDPAIVQCNTTGNSKILYYEY